VCEGGIGAAQHDCHKNYPFDAQVALHALLRHRALLELVDVSICPSRSLAERLERNGQPESYIERHRTDPEPAFGRT
jgi:hypothetical protein